MAEANISAAVADEVTVSKIYFVRGQKVMLDRDLAELYGVTTGNLNKAVKKKLEAFPERFYVSACRRRIQKLDIPKWNIKLGRHEKNA